MKFTQTLRANDLFDELQDASGWSREHVKDFLEEVRDLVIEIALEDIEEIGLEKYKEREW